jgi:hypothetical protein
MQQFECMSQAGTGLHGSCTFGLPTVLAATQQTGLDMWLCSCLVLPPSPITCSTVCGRPKLYHRSKMLVELSGSSELLSSLRIMHKRLLTASHRSHAVLRPLNHASD